VPRDHRVGSEANPWTAGSEFFGSPDMVLTEEKRWCWLRRRMSMDSKKKGKDGSWKEDAEVREACQLANKRFRAAQILTARG
jgi:hypothetical protein